MKKVVLNVLEYNINKNKILMIICLLSIGPSRNFFDERFFFDVSSMSINEK